MDPDQQNDLASGDANMDGENNASGETAGDADANLSGEGDGATKQEPAGPESTPQTQPSGEDVASGEQQAAAEGAQVDEDETHPVGPLELAFNGAMAGMLYGAILGTISMLIAHLAGGVRIPASMMGTLPLGLIVGAGGGAVVGIVTVLTETAVAGVLTGLALMSALKIGALASVKLWWDVTGVGVTLSLIDGLIFGIVVAMLVYRAIDWSRVEAPEDLGG